MKIRIVILFCLLSLSVFGQTFKEVKTAQDVIDNYITANGGEDNLKSVKSIAMEGNMLIMGSDVPIKIYTGNNIFYMDFAHSQFGITMAMDTKNRKGWSKFGGKLKDATEQDIEKNKANIASSLWAYYVDKDKYGISYELLQNEKVDGKDAYTVDFKNKDSLIQTVYFDTETFQRVKQIKGNNTSEYSDLRNVDNSGIYMPYKIVTGQGEVIASKYLFNSKFDKKLLKKPEEKEEK